MEAGLTQYLNFQFLNFRPPQGITGVHDISTRKVYPPRLLPSDAVRSYRTFSPLPNEGEIEKLRN